MRAWWTASAGVAVVLTLACDGGPTRPGQPEVALVSLQLSGPPATLLAALSINAARVQLAPLGGTTLVDTVAPFDPDARSLQLALSVLLSSSAESLDVSLDLLAGSQVLFSGTRRIEARAGTAATPAPILLSYVGPGQQIAALTLGPVDSVVRLGDSLQLRVTAVDSSLQPVGTFYTSWSVSDTTAGQINADGLFRARNNRAAIMVRVVTPTGIRDSTPLTLVPVPTAVALVSGDQQVGAAGSALPQPLVVRVTAADLLGVKGVPVGFSATIGGGSVDLAIVLTDAGGLAQTTATLGGGTGAQAFEAAVTGLAPVAFSATATSGVTPGRVFTANAGSWDITALFTATVTVDTVDCTGVGATCSEPRNPAYNHAGTLVAVPHRFSNNLLLLDPAIPDFIAEVQDTSFHEPYAAIFTANDQQVWVANKFGGGSTEGTVSVVDVTSRTVVAVVRDTTFGSPEGIVISGSRAYVANRGKNTITVVDVPTRAVVARIDLGVSNTPRHLVATPNGLLVYASTSTSSVARIQTSDNSVTIIPTVGFGSSRNLAVRPDGAFVYAAMQNSEVAVVNVSTGGVTMMTFSGASSLYGVAILADGSLGFVSDEGGDLIHAFDPATNTPVTPAGYPVPTNSTPRGITAY